MPERALRPLPFPALLSALALAEAGLAWQRGKVGVNLVYLGEFGSQRRSHAGRLSVRLEF